MIPVPEKAKDKVEGIQALRAVAAFLVVLLHVSVSVAKFGNPNMRFFESFVAGHAGVDIFFVISGFVMVITSVRRSGSASEAVWFLEKRAVRIYPVYWFYCALVLAVWLTFPQWVNASAAGESNVVASFLLYPAEGIPLLMVAWTLEFEVFFYLLFACAMCLPVRYALRALLLVLLGLVCFGAVTELDGDLAKVVFSPMLLEFAAGCLVGTAYLKSITVGGTVATLAGLAVLIVSSLGVEWSVVSGIAETDFSRPLTYGLSGVLLVYGLVSLERRGRLRYPRFLLALGDASYTWYLSHLLVLSAAGRIWRAAGADRLPDPLLVVVLIALSTGWAVLGYRYIEQPLILWARRRIKSLRVRRSATQPGPV